MKNINPLKNQLICMIFSFLFITCNKPASTGFSQDIFIPVGANEKVKAIIRELNSNIQHLTIVDSITKRFGEPLWLKAVVSGKNDEVEIFVPTKSSMMNGVSGFFVFNLAHKLTFDYIDASDIRTYGFSNTGGRINARAVFLLQQAFNSSLYPSARITMDEPCMLTRAELSRVSMARIANPTAKLNLKFVEVSECIIWTACTGDGNGNCIGNITMNTFCLDEVTWIPEGGLENVYGNDPSAVNSSVGSQNGSSRPQPSNPPQDCNTYQSNNENAFFLTASKPIQNIRKYTSCFLPTQPAKITFCADVPRPGTLVFVDAIEKAGHVFVVIEQNVGGKVIRRSLGFYPSQEISPFKVKDTKSQLGDDSNTDYDHSYSASVTGAQFGNILNIIENFSPVYNLETYNCVNFVMDISDAAGLKIKRSNGNWSGLNPAAFGRELLNYGGIAQLETSASNAGCL